MVTAEMQLGRVYVMLGDDGDDDEGEVVERSSPEAERSR
jgi:hypothetical protein